MQPYTPDDLPLQNLNFQLLLGLVGRANAALARYDGLLQGIPNPAVMLSPLTTQAVLSSKIEGTQVTVDEVLQQEAGLLKDGRIFWRYRITVRRSTRHVIICSPIRFAWVLCLNCTAYCWTAYAVRIKPLVSFAGIKTG